MACGVPVVTSDTSSLPEVVGDAGLLVSPREPGAIAGRIKALLDNPERARELGRRGVERAGRFRWDRAAREMEEVFAEALS
jgi:glycosyltransferase involved in cell wall biosynthesis